MRPFVLAYILPSLDNANVFLGADPGMLLQAGAINETLYRKILAAFGRLDRRLEISAGGASVAQDLNDGQTFGELFARAMPLAGIDPGPGIAPDGPFAVCRCEDPGYRFAVCAEFPHARPAPPSWQGAPCAVRAAGRDPWISSASLLSLFEKNALGAATASRPWRPPATPAL